MNSHDLTPEPYRGYRARIESCPETGKPRGRLLAKGTEMYFLARDRVGAKAEFESLVDQYLADCDDKGEQPGVPL